MVGYFVVVDDLAAIDLIVPLALHSELVLSAAHSVIVEAAFWEQFHLVASGFAVVAKVSDDCFEFEGEEDCRQSLLRFHYCFVLASGDLDGSDYYDFC